ncbi:MAG: DNA-directed RNA polymerase subunit delta [Firmicutes bacterium]|nr:DNA-directed RNA polymerase subunit delta [Dethiobacter sp.]MBS3887813.1 DNA-directed RNA polymerase subunit delta [Bacillota bacterium]MBS4054844.1 DNA-directed RNA polymerase subunit delta [Thermaerobacter sp.]
MNTPLNKKREPIPDTGLRILRTRRQTMHYKDLVNEIVVERGEEQLSTPEHLAHVLTQINLDARFVHMGKGYWGLRDWAGGQQKYTPVIIPGEGDYQPKPGDYIFVEDDDTDDESELLIPVPDEEEEVFPEEESEPLGSDDEDDDDDE